MDVLQIVLNAIMPHYQGIAFLIYTAFVLALSFILSNALTPVIIYLLRRISSTTKNSLDDRIIHSISTPISSFSILIFLYVIITLFPDNLNIAKSYYDKYVSGVFIVILAYLATRILKAFLDWYFEEGHKTSKIKIDISLLPFIHRVATIVIMGIGITTGLAVTGFDVTSILTITSVIGVVVGLASQETLANIFAGLALQLDRPYNYGDYLRFATGEVVRLRKIGMRSTKLYDLSGNLMILSNSEFAKQRLTKVGAVQKQANVSITFELPYTIPITDVIEALKSDFVKARDFVVDGSDISGSYLKIRKDYYEGAINIKVKDLSYTPRANAWVNENIAKLIDKKTQK